MKLIDADALKKRLIERRDEIAEVRRYGWEWEYNGFNGAILLTGSEAAMHKVTPEPQWIPCSERLPEEEKRHYWVCTDTGYQCQCRWTNDVYGLGVSDRWEWKIFDIPQYQKVIAWMPLPKPYRAEGK